MDEGMDGEKTVFGDRVRMLLARHGRDRAWLDSKLGVEPPTISRYLVGSRTASVEVVSAVAAIFGVLPDELTGGLPMLTDQEREAFELFRMVPDAERGPLLQLMRALSGATGNDEKNVPERNEDN